MVPSVLQISSSIAGSSTSLESFLTSSLFPSYRPSFPSPRATSQPSFHGVFASSKQKKRRPTQQPSTSRDWSYEHLMVVWDEVFESYCQDPAKATQVMNLSERGLASYGRGCVLVQESVQTRPRGAGTGFTSKPPKSSLEVPAFVSIGSCAAYVPREFLIDPRKAEVNTENPSNGAAVIDVTPVSMLSDGSKALSDEDLAQGESVQANGSSASQGETTVQCGQTKVTEACDVVQLVSLPMLLSARRGMDVTRLLSLTANFDSEIDDLTTANKATVIDMKTMDAGGEDPYNPKKGELVLMLHLLVDGRPAVGADVLIAYQHEVGSSDAENKSSWKLRLKYSI